MMSRTRIILALAAVVMSLIADSKHKGIIKNKIVEYTIAVSR